MYDMISGEQKIHITYQDRIDFIYLAFGEIYVQGLYTSFSNYQPTNLSYEFISYKAQTITRIMFTKKNNSVVTNQQKGHVLKLVLRP